jgi:hypothetical protein
MQLRQAARTASAITSRIAQCLRSPLIHQDGMKRIGGIMKLAQVIGGPGLGTRGMSA